MTKTLYASASASRVGGFAGRAYCEDEDRSNRDSRVKKLTPTLPLAPPVLNIVSARLR
jgi:hypothetical protein